MAAYHAARTLVDAGAAAQVTVLEKMPRPARKIMITGKGRCNFTNLKDWNAFSGHIRSKPNFVKSAFYNLPSQAVFDWFEGFGMPAVVERGDGLYQVDAEESVSDVFERLGFEDPEEDEELVNTRMGEWAYEQFTDIPDAGDSFRYHGLEVTVSEVEHNRIRKLQVRLLPEEEEGGEEA